MWIQERFVFTSFGLAHYLSLREFRCISKLIRTPLADEKKIKKKERKKRGKGVTQMRYSTIIKSNLYILGLEQSVSQRRKLGKEKVT